MLRVRDLPIGKAPAFAYPSLSDILFTICPPHPKSAVNRGLVVSLEQIFAERTAAAIDALISSAWEIVAFRLAVEEKWTVPNAGLP